VMASCARRVAVRRFECRRFGLGMENPFVRLSALSKTDIRFD